MFSPMGGCEMHKGNVVKVNSLGPVLKPCRCFEFLKVPVLQKTLY
ncbi:hypothetical protein LEMLEM_LOCUS21458 [Lemmus lemmus]